MFMAFRMFCIKWRFSEERVIMSLLSLIELSVLLLGLQDLNFFSLNDES